MSEERIRDIPQHKKALAEVEGAIALAKLAKALGPILPERARRALSELDPKKIEQMRNDMETLASLPDRFNDHFSKRGWVAWQDMNGDVALAAINLADQGKFNEAEEVLTAYWTKDIIRCHITRLKRVAAFIPRWRLAVDAEELYEAGKYHACTLMVLSVMDGMVQEVSAKHIGINQNFSAEKTDLQAWDSIAGHSSGLRTLKEIMLTPRKKTNTEPISIPYRHGVVHGMDVNFNSKIVAAKAWAALFAVGQWAFLAQKKALDERPPEQPKPIIEQIRKAEVEELKRANAAFKPRDAWQQGKLPPRGGPEEYEENTPERALVQFLSWWQAGNYGKMAAAITAIGKPAHPSDLKSWFEGKELLEYELVDVKDIAPARSHVSVKVRVRDRRAQREWTTTVDVAMTKKLDEGTVEEKAVPWTFYNYFSLARPPKLE